MRSRGWNASLLLRASPKSGESLSNFHDRRASSETCEILRLVIEFLFVFLKEDKLGSGVDIDIYQVTKNEIKWPEYIDATSAVLKLLSCFR